jgi:two-component system, chemotaxis family, protein-glutamate methylesterase/glutaminase
MNPQKKIRVLVVDDSAVVRRVIADTLGRDPEIEVVGTAADPYIARDKILELDPDVLTLDIEMPRMDGLTFLRILQQHRPMPVVVISSLTQRGSLTALQAMELGAVDVLAKPSSAWNLGNLREQLALRIKGAAQARLTKFKGTPVGPGPVVEAGSVRFLPRQLVVMGASTGGTEALKNVLTRLPDGLPGICIVQHIPPIFSKAFADRLNECCAFEVREAVSGDELHTGLALVAPGDYHMTLDWNGAVYRVSLEQGPMIHHVRPAVDVLFNSAVCAGSNALAVLLTGMGRDGAQGMLALKAAGAVTLAQNEETCIVYGMPRAAVELGAVDKVLPLDLMPHAILHALQSAATKSHPGQAPSPLLNQSRPNPFHNSSNH